MYWALVGSLVGSLLGIFAYIYYLRQGQFEDPEDVKYQMFREEKEESF